jgi:hypothetical protein
MQLQEKGRRQKGMKRERQEGGHRERREGDTDKRRGKLEMRKAKSGFV